MITHLEHQVVVRVGVAGERRRRRRLEEHDEPAEVAAHERGERHREQRARRVRLAVPRLPRRAQLDEELVGEGVDLGVFLCTGKRRARQRIGVRELRGELRGENCAARIARRVHTCTGTFSYSPLGVRHLCSDVQKVIIRRVKACHTWRSR